MNPPSLDQGWHTQFLTKIQKLDGFGLLAPCRVRSRYAAYACASRAHAMKFARKARDFFRAYRMGASGGEVEKQRRQFRAHRCMLDCYYTFVTDEE